MLVRMKPGEQRVLSERAKEVGVSLSRYLIDCGLFECGLRPGILTPQDRYWLEFLAFQVALVRGDLKENNSQAHFGWIQRLVRRWST